MQHQTQCDFRNCHKLFPLNALWLSSFLPYRVFVACGLLIFSAAVDICNVQRYIQQSLHRAKVDYGEEQMSPLVSSLGIRLLVPIFLIAGVVMTIHALVTFDSTKGHFLRFVEGDIDRYSGLIKRATHDGMLLNNKADVQLMIERLTAGSELASVRVYDKDGFIRMSGNRDEIGRRMEMQCETCLSCHQAEPARDTAVLERRGMAYMEGGIEVLRHLSVIENETSCATAACHAHPEENRVLGVLDVEMSLVPVDAAVATSRRQILWTTLILIMVVCLVVAIVIRKLVQRPIAQLYDGIRRIADGDMETHIDIRGQHELARLAEAFNDMAQDLGAARQEVTEWSQKLEDKVIEKTTQLSRAQRQVLHMEKMASLGKLSATVAHELNNPISGMLTYARLVRRELQDQPLPDEVRDEWSRYLQMVEKECRRCGAIVQNLLLFTRRMGAETAEIDLNEVVEQSIMLVLHQLKMADIELHKQLLADDSRIVADEAQVQQAIVALLVNAVEALTDSQRADRRISVCLEGETEGVRIDIEDSGGGIPPEVLPHIFEPFFSTKHTESGVGLGLAVVYGIVERHGGRIDVDSVVNQGTTFHVWLPRKPSVNDAPTSIAFGHLPLNE